MNITKKSYRDYFFTHPVVASNPRFHWLSPMETASVSRCLVVRGDWITTSQPIYVSYVSSLVRASLAVRASFHSRLKHFHFTLASRRRLLIPIQLTSVIPATFYRAMLCIARTMPSQDVCPSVHLFLCLSVTRRYSGNGCTYPQNFFSASDTHIILLFSVPNGMAIFRRGPPNWGVKCTGVWKNRDVRPIYRFISKLIQDRAIVTTECE